MNSETGDHHLTDGESTLPPPYQTDQDLHFDQEGLHTEAKLTDEGRLNITINDDTDSLRRILSPVLHEAEVDSSAQNPSDAVDGHALIPSLNIAIQVIGSRGDIQPFISMGQVLKSYGHRVRLATHPTFKKFVEENGLEFFNIGGDPAELMAFMVKNPGLMPGMEAIRSGEIGKRRKGMAEILEGCWRSCIQLGDGMEEYDDESDQNTKPFIADAIIANPPSLAHIHCAERLRIPLHLMFTMPWSPTEAFPHPLASIETSNADPNLTNFLSYILVETMTWQGLGDLVNKFRVQSLGLGPIHPTWGPGMAIGLKIPYTYAWSPALIPKPHDWGSHISVAGFYFLSLASSYIPPDDLSEFLNSGPPPIYIGFGSIVVDDADGLTALILEAVERTKVRALISVGWGGLGSKKDQLPDNVFLLGNCPHDWLFKKVSCVVHHGGAGTTAAGIAAGVPTVIVPFFGDQPFWGDMVARAGAGPVPIPFKQLTSARLAAAISKALLPETTGKAAQLGSSIQNENGSKDGADCFHKQLPLQQMSCSLDPDHIPVWKVPKKDIRLSAMAAVILANEGLLNIDDLKIYGPCTYDTERGAAEPISGLVAATTGIIGDVVLGFTDISRGVYQSLGKKSEKTRPTESIEEPDSAISNQSESLKEIPSAPKGGPRRKLTKPRPHIAELEMADISQKPSPIKKGLARLGGAALTGPMTLTVGVAEGLHNAPRLCGDTTVRPSDKITGLQSGLKAAGKELGLGVYDGFSGVVTQPMKGQKESGRSGLIKGIGKGIGGILIKPIAGVSGLFGFTFKGIYREVQKKFGLTAETHIRTVRIMQGYHQLESITDEQYRKIVDKWHAL